MCLGLEKMRSLVIIDSPYSLFVYSMNCLDDDSYKDILIVNGGGRSMPEENYKKIVSLLEIKNIRNLNFSTFQSRWNIKRDSGVMVDVKTYMSEIGLTDVNIKKYNFCYLNSYCSAEAFFVSTLRSYVAIEHCGLDSLRHSKINYFFKSFYFFIKTGIFRYRYLKYLKLEKDKYFKLQNRVKNKIDIKDNILEGQKNVLFLYGTHHSYSNVAEDVYIKMNLKVLEEASCLFDMNSCNLIIKFHHRVGELKREEKSSIKSKLELSGFNVIFVDQIFDNLSSIVPAEMLVYFIPNLQYIIIMDSSASWSLARIFNERVISAHLCFGDLVGRSKYLQKNYKKLARLKIAQPYSLFKKRYKTTDLKADSTKNRNTF